MNVYTEMCVSEGVRVSVCECEYVSVCMYMLQDNHCGGREVASRVCFRQFENHGSTKANS